MQPTAAPVLRGRGPALAEPWRQGESRGKPQRPTFALSATVLSKEKGVLYKEKPPPAHDFNTNKHQTPVGTESAATVLRNPQDHSRGPVVLPSDQCAHRTKPVTPAKMASDVVFRATLSGFRMCRRQTGGTREVRRARSDLEVLCHDVVCDARRVQRVERRRLEANQPVPHVLESLLVLLKLSLEWTTNAPPRTNGKSAASSFTTTNGSAMRFSSESRGGKRQRRAAQGKAVSCCDNSPGAPPSPTSVSSSGH